MKYYKKESDTCQETLAEKICKELMSAFSTREIETMVTATDPSFLSYPAPNIPLANMIYKRMNASVMMSENKASQVRKWRPLTI